MQVGQEVPAKGLRMAKPGQRATITDREVMLNILRNTETIIANQALMLAVGAYRDSKSDIQHQGAIRPAPILLTSTPPAETVILRAPEQTSPIAGS